tara:strand:+ start:1280 stop:1600 length:321 start_codon:yes stop_codon:yes gene_type:complete
MNKVTDNFELDFPARMNDGRQFTDYRQNCLMNNNTTMKETSWLFRQELINNADNYLNSFENIQEQNSKCNTCKDNTVLNIQNYQQCSPTGCTYSVNDALGVGLGRR